jgi:hypothetical protein
MGSPSNVLEWVLVGLFAGFGWAIGTAAGAWTVELVKRIGK